MPLMASNEKLTTSNRTMKQSNRSRGVEQHKNGVGRGGHRATNQQRDHMR